MMNLNIQNDNSYQNFYHEENIKFTGGALLRII